MVADSAVSSPPIVIRRFTPSWSNERTVVSSSAALLVGLAREMPMNEPPRKWIRLTASIVSGRVWPTSPSISHSKPSSMPTTSRSSSPARMVAALMTLLMPGAGPPPTRMPRRPPGLTTRASFRARRLECAGQKADRAGRLGVAGLEQEVGIPAVGLVTEHEEVGLGVDELIRAEDWRVEAVGGARSGECGRQLH